MPHASSSSLDIIIIGAGLGGLSAAISCALGGHNVIVLEGARQLAEVPPVLLTVTCTVPSADHISSRLVLVSKSHPSEKDRLYPCNRHI